MQRIDYRSERQPLEPPAPGVYEDVPADTYHQWAALSSSQISIGARSPAHLKAYLDGRLDVSSEGFAFGTLAHSLTLEPERELAEFTFYPNFGPLNRKPGKDARNAWLESQGIDERDKDGWEKAQAQFGETLVSEDDLDHARMISASIRSHPMAAKILDTNRAKSCELSLVWDDESGLPCKARLDILSDELRLVGDLKTTTDASRAFARAMGRFGYHRQAAWYRHGVEKSLGQTYDFVLVAVEKSEPYALSVFTPGDATLRTGSIECRKVRDAVVSAKKAGRWPGYSDRVEEIDLLPYQLASELEGGEL